MHIISDRTVGMQRLKMCYLYIRTQPTRIHIANQTWTGVPPLRTKFVRATRDEKRKYHLFQVQSLFFQRKLAHTYNWKIAKECSLRITCVVLHRKRFQIEYLKWSLGRFFVFAAKCTLLVVGWFLSWIPAAIQSLCYTCFFILLYPYPAS